MDSILLAEQLRAEGLSANDWCRMADRSELVRLRRGAYVRPDAAQHEQLLRHRQLIAASLPMLSTETVISHSSAAVLHGLPVRIADLDTVSVTRSRPYGGRLSQPVHIYPAPLDPSHVTMINGLPVTTMARTVVDLARHSKLRRAVVIADAALQLGLSPEELDDAVAAGRRRPGIILARRAVKLADGRSESAGESYSRVTLIELGLPPTHLQYEVRDDRGMFVGRADFCWEDRRTLGEFDGKIKYGELIAPGRSPGDVLFEEKQREDALRSLGWEVVRWIWADLQHPERLAASLERAFARAARRR